MPHLVQTQLKSLHWREVAEPEEAGGAGKPLIDRHRGRKPSVRGDVDPERAAWELISVFWLRDVAYLMDLGRSVYEGSSVLMDTILHSIST